VVLVNAPNGGIGPAIFGADQDSSNFLKAFNLVNPTQEVGQKFKSSGKIDHQGFSGTAKLSDFMFITTGQFEVNGKTIQVTNASAVQDDILNKIVEAISTDPNNRTATVTYVAATKKIKIEGETITPQSNMFGAQNGNGESNFLEAVNFASPVITVHKVTSSAAIQLKQLTHSRFTDTHDKKLFPINPYKDLRIRIFHEDQDRNPTNLTLTPEIESQVEFITALDQLSASEQEKLIESILLAANQIPKLDVAPNVLVTGMGTKAFQWKINYGNMGQVVSKITNKSLSADFKKIGAHKVTGVEGTARKIKFVVGSEKNDWIYSYQEADEKRIGNNFLVTAESFEGDNKHHLLKVPQNLALQTGQPVLYKSDTPINGLISGKIYFVEVVPNQEINTTQLKFLSSLEEVPKIGPILKTPDRIKLKWTDTLNNTHHEFIEVVGADGGAGNDRLIPNIRAKATLLLGGKGDDILVGTAGVDYLDGGEANDKIFVDGSHAPINTIDNFLDTISGGSGDDFIYGYKHQNFLR